MMATNRRTMMTNDKTIPGGRHHTDDDGPMVMIVDENDEAYSTGGRNHTDEHYIIVRCENCDVVGRRLHLF